MTAFYNDTDPNAAAWLRALMVEGLIAPGPADGRSIADVLPEEISGYARCHFFAGIGGWDFALRLAGWPAERPVWTGSCPCQPFSTAGKGAGEEDPRHLWPVFFRLIRECRPATVFGEQVASNLGCQWLARVRTDLESAGYAVGCADLPAACLGAPHIRQRLFWVAGCSVLRRDAGGLSAPQAGVGGAGQLNGRCVVGHLPAPRPGEAVEGRPPDAQPGIPGQLQAGPGGPSGAGGLGDAAKPGCQAQRTRAVGNGQGGRAALHGSKDFWSDFDVVPCRDGKARRVESGSFPLAYGIPRELGPLLAVLERMGVDPKTAKRCVRNARGRLAKAGRNRVGRLRGYGNAIVPEVAAAFIRAFLESAS